MGKNIDISYPMDSVSNSSDDILDAISDLSIHNIMNSEFLKMITNSNIYVHDRESYDSKYDIEVVAGTENKDENERAYTPVTVKVYKKDSDIPIERTENIYKMYVFDESNFISSDNNTSDNNKKDNTKTDSGTDTKGTDDKKDDTKTDSGSGSSTSTGSGSTSSGGSDDKTKDDNALVLTNSYYKMSQVYPSFYQTFTKLPEDFNSNALTTTESMYYDCTNLKEIPQINTNKITNMSRMFYQCKNLISVPNMDTSNVADMGAMFAGCLNLTTIPKLNTSNVIGMSSMFANCQKLISIPEMDTSKSKNMDSMFESCFSLTSIPWEINMASCDNYLNMFLGVPAKDIKLKNVPRNFNPDFAKLATGSYTIISYRNS